jgi:hypothetical protein
MTMRLTVSVDHRLIAKTRERAAALGTGVSQLVREYLLQLAGSTDLTAAATEFESLSAQAKGDSRRWKFNREDSGTPTAPRYESYQVHIRHRGQHFYFVLNELLHTFQLP